MGVLQTRAVLLRVYIGPLIFGHSHVTEQDREGFHKWYTLASMVTRSPVRYDIMFDVRPNKECGTIMLVTAEALQCSTCDLKRLMIEILHDLLYQKHRSSSNIVHTYKYIQGDGEFRLSAVLHYLGSWTLREALQH